MPGRIAQLLARRGLFWLLLPILAVESLFWSVYSHRHRPWLDLGAPWAQRCGCHPRRQIAMIVEMNGQVRVVDYGGAEAEELRPRIAAGLAIDRGKVQCLPDRGTFGLLAPVVEVHDHTLFPASLLASLLPQQRSDVRKGVAQMLANDPGESLAHDSEFLSRLVQGDGRITIIHWHWLAHDVLFAILIIACLRSMQICYIRPAIERQHLQRRHNSLALGLCPRCGYSIEGLKANARVCPECGEDLNA